MAVTSPSEVEKLINDFVQEIIRSAQLKVKNENGITIGQLAETGSVTPEVSNDVRILTTR